MPPSKQERDEMVTRFRAVVSSAVLKDGPHLQKEVIGGFGKEDWPRYYTVTTFSAGPGYGGDRTPIVCSSFEKAKEIVENNVGDIWECSYSLCVISAFYLDCMYGVPWVMKENLEPGTEVTYINENRQTMISGAAMEQEEYWYVWKFDGEQKPDEGRYVPCFCPPNFMRGGPVG